MWHVSDDQQRSGAQCRQRGHRGLQMRRGGSGRHHGSSAVRRLRRHQPRPNIRWREQRLCEVKVDMRGTTFGAARGVPCDARAVGGCDSVCARADGQVGHRVRCEEPRLLDALARTPRRSPFWAVRGEHHQRHLGVEGLDHRRREVHRSGARGAAQESGVVTVLAQAECEERRLALVDAHVQRDEVEFRRLRERDRDRSVARARGQDCVLQAEVDEALDECVGVRRRFGCGVWRYRPRTTRIRLAHGDKRALPQRIARPRGGRVPAPADSHVGWYRSTDIAQIVSRGRHSCSALDAAGGTGRDPVLK